jgi:hypothetical protein
LLFLSFLWLLLFPSGVSLVCVPLDLPLSIPLSLSPSLTLFMLRLTYPPCPVILRLLFSVSISPSLLRLHCFLALSAFRLSLHSLSFLLTNSFLPIQHSLSCLCFAYSCFASPTRPVRSFSACLFTLFPHLSSGYTIFWPCRRSACLSPTFHFPPHYLFSLTIPLFSGYRLSHASTHLPALSGDSQLTFLSLYHSLPTILLTLYFLAIASLMPRLTYPPCPVILSLLFHSFTSLYHYFTIPLFY